MTGAAAWRLPLERVGAAPSIARAALDSRLASWPAELRDCARLVTSELVTNAVLHGLPAIELTLTERPLGIRLAVSDGSTVLPHVRDYGSAAQSGRGLSLVVALSVAWGAERTRTGKVVWAELLPVPNSGLPEAAGPVAPPDASAGVSERAGWLAGSLPVVFRGVPTDGYLRLQQHQDALLREAELVALSAAFPEVGDRPPPAHVARVLADVQQALARPPEAIRQAVAAAAQRQEATVDVTVALFPGAAETAASLVRLLDAVDDLARQGHLLLDPAPPETVQLRHWFVEQMAVQLKAVAADAGARTAR